MLADESAFLDLVLRNANNRVILERAGRLGLPDWWLTAGAVFQSVWNGLTGRHAATAIRDYDLFYFDGDDLTAESEQQVQNAAARLFDDLDIVVETCNEARVHLWYEDEFAAPGVRFTSSRDAIDHFAATTCMFAITRHDNALQVYAPHGYADLFSLRVRPNAVLAPRHVYETKARRWTREWPALKVEPWPDHTHRSAWVTSPGSGAAHHYD